MLLLAGGAAAAVLLLRDDGPPPAPKRPPARAEPDAPPYDAAGFEPFAYEPAREHALRRRAELGQAHVVYALSPGGAERSARRSARWRDEVELAAAEVRGVDPDDLEAMLLLESAGRPEVMADGTPSSATGLMQILPETGSGLLGMRVELERSIRLTRRIARNRRRALVSRSPRKRRIARRLVRELRAERRRVDERFDPPKALAGAVRYLTIARRHFGRADLAIASYHMGIGNLRGLIDAYVAPRPRARTTHRTVRRYGITYARLYFDSSPTRNPRTWARLNELGDDTRHYLFKVGSSRRIMRLLRDDPAALRDLIELQTAKASAEEVLRPRADFPPYADGDDLRRAYRRGELVPLPQDPRRLGFRVDRRMGAHARRLEQPRILYQGLRREALATLLYIAKEVRRIRGRPGALRVTSTVRDLPYQRLLVASNAQATRAFSLHTTGFAIDIARPRREAALRYVLERLQALNLIAFVTEPGAFHLTVGPGAKAFMPLYEALVVDRRPLARSRR